MTKKSWTILALVALVAMPLGGWWAGPSLARVNATVQLAGRIWKEDSEGLAGRTLESETFRAGGRAREDLFADAARIERQFAVGTAILGLWCAVVIGSKLLYRIRPLPREFYEIDHAQCVVCCRCFLACPREKLRRRELAGD